MGHWIVQDRPGWICVGGGDMKGEQTIQRVSKGPGGLYVVGATRNANYVAEIELLFHEIGSITNVLNFLKTNYTMKHKACTDHQSPSHIQQECCKAAGLCARAS